MKGKDEELLVRLTERFKAGETLSRSERRQLRKLTGRVAEKPWRKRGHQKRKLRTRTPTEQEEMMARALLIANRKHHAADPYA